MKTGKYAAASNEELLKRLQSRDLEAFNAIYNRYWDRLLNESYKRLDDMTACEEIVQDVFLNLWETCSSRHIQDLEAYLFACMKFNVFAAYKKLQKKKSLFNPLFADQQDNNVAIATDGQYLEKDLKLFLEKWIAHLPQKRGEIFRLRFLEGLSTKEISEIVNSSQNTVQNHLSVSIQKLRKLILQHFLLILWVLFTQ